MAGQYPGYPPRAFSPLQRTGSPHGGPYPPDPNKRPMYPSPQPHYGSTGPSNIALPNQVFSSPYYGTPQQNGGPPSHGYNIGSPYSPHTPYNTSPHYPPPHQQPPIPLTPQQHTPTGGTMGPPLRPANENKPTDINDLGDVLSGSGIDLKEEEAAMYRSYPGDRQYGSNQLQEVAIHTPTPYPFSRDNHYLPYVPGDRQSFYGAGVFNQPPAPYKSIEAIAEEEKKRAIRRKAEIKQYHMNDPFLQTGVLRRRFDQERNKTHVKFDDVGLLVRDKDQPPREYRIHGPDGNDVVRVLQNEDILQFDNTLVEILALLSLATQERMRVIVEDAAVLAKGRRVKAVGVAPPDLNGPTAGKQSSEAADALPTPSNGAASPSSNPLKRSYSEANNTLTPVSSASDAALSMPRVNAVVQALREMTRIDRMHEEARLAKRQRRAAKAKGDSGSLEGAAIPGALGDGAPDTKKAPKKAKGAMDNATQAQQLNALNNTTQMALGGKKMPSWLTGGGSKGPSNPYLKSNANAQKATASNANAPGSSLPKNRVFGEFREDKVEGSGIQLRDVILILEQHGKEKKALQLAYGRQ